MTRGCLLPYMNTAWEAGNKSRPTPPSNWTKRLRDVPMRFITTKLCPTAGVDAMSRLNQASQKRYEFHQSLHFASTFCLCIDRYS